MCQTIKQDSYLHQRYMLAAAMSIAIYKGSSIVIRHIRKCRWEWRGGRILGSVLRQKRLDASMSGQTAAWMLGISGFPTQSSEFIHQICVASLHPTSQAFIVLLVPEWGRTPPGPAERSTNRTSSLGGSRQNSDCNWQHARPRHLFGQWALVF